MPRKQTYSTPPRDYPAQKARQGEIILTSRLQRIIFIVGLAGFVVVALALNFLR